MSLSDYLVPVPSLLDPDLDLSLSAEREAELCARLSALAEARGRAWVEIRTYTVR